MTKENDGLSEREHRVLEAIIRNYILRASPASSTFIAKLHGFNLSSASIRNVMSELEEGGFISQPHTSAGRVPTDKGYRYYVDHCMKSVALPVRFRRQIHDTLARSGAADLHLLLEAAVRGLCCVTRQLCVVLAPRFGNAVLRGLYVFPVGRRRYLMNLTIDGGLVKTTVFELPTEVCLDDLAAACRMIVSRFAGRMLIDICDSAPRGFRDAPRPYGDAAVLLLPCLRAMADGAAEASHAYTEGETTLLLQPEFFNSDGVEEVKRMCGTAETLIDLETISEEKKEKAVIEIGRELPCDAPHSFSLIKTRYRVGRLNGSLGVIGPKRMPYPFLIAAVEYMARALGEACA